MNLLFGRVKGHREKQAIKALKWLISHGSWVAKTGGGLEYKIILTESEWEDIYRISEEVKK